MRISVNVSAFDAFTRASDVEVSPSSVAPTAAAAGGYSSLLAGLCVVSVFLFVAVMVILGQNIASIANLLAQVNGLIDRMRACLPNAGSVDEEGVEMDQVPASNAVSVDAGRNLSDSDRAARARSLVGCV